MACVEPLDPQLPAAYSSALRVLLADQHCIVRHGVRALLEANAQFVVVGEAAGVGEALSLVERLQPDAIVTELNLREGCALRLIEETHARFPSIAIVVLSEFCAPDRVAAARRAGARGYVMKGYGRRELEAALRTTSTGRWYGAAGAGTTHRARLTSRQHQVLRLLAVGCPARQIATKMGISLRAVYRLCERLEDTLQVRGISGLLRFAVREGLISDQPDAMTIEDRMPGPSATAELSPA
jgi:two-component system, NarL family, nitrate/nitrite response regulator NarL